MNRDSEKSSAKPQGWKRILWVAVAVSSILAACAPRLPIRQRSVSISADGADRTVETQASTVRELLAEQGITLGPLDRVKPPETALLVDSTVVLVTRVVEVTETYTSTVPFERQIVRDATVPEGDERLLQSGKSGLRTQVYRVTLEDGVEIERILAEEMLTTAPQDEIRLIGTRPELATVNTTGVLVYLNGQDAWIIRGSNRERQRMTSLGDLDGRVFALSPDGSRLLFTRAVTDSGKLNELWLVSSVEASAQAVPVAVDDVLWADWSPTSDVIAWSTAEAMDLPPGWRGKNDLWTGTLARGGTLSNRRQILESQAGGGYGWWGTRYTWSPSGEQIALSRPESISVVALRNAAVTELAKFPAYRTYSSWAWNPSVSWSSDGSFLATVVHGPAPDSATDPELSPVFDLVLVEANGAYSVTLAAEVGMWASPEFSPDGESILFGRAIIPYQSSSSAYRLCSTDRDGSDQACQLPTDEEEGIEIPEWEWGPDGASYAFIAEGNIYLTDLIRGETAPLTDQGATSQLDWRAAGTGR